MGEKNTQEKAPSFVLGWLIAPLAVLLAFVSSEAVGFELINETSGIEFGMLIGAAILATLPRILRDNETLSLSKGQISLTFFIVASIAAFGISQYVSPVVGILFMILAFGGFLLDNNHRFEASTILTFTVIGLMVSMAIAGMADTWAPELFDVEGNGTEQLVIDNHREAIGFLFFSALISSILIGGIVAIAQRGVLLPCGQGNWAKYLPQPNGMLPAKSSLPLLLALGVWVAAHIASMIHFGMS
ncbi:MAG: hypothetical protein QGH90_08540, partial [Candidatus Poseidoniaceae archaeon]|nr:hypothetical protein [Candidatus Poseidoniaceae archaeon]